MFSIKEAIRFGWQTFKAHWKFLVALTVVVQGFSLVSTSLANVLNLQTSEGENIGPSLIFGAILWLIQSVFTLGRVRINLDIVDGAGGQWGQLLGQYKRLPAYVVGSIINLVLIGLGTLLFVVPGIIVAVRLSFWTVALVDKGVGPWQAMKVSWAVTKGSTIKLLLWGAVAATLSVVAALPLGLGLLVALPVIFLGSVSIYRKLSSG